jgi:hypothetical protein
LLIPRRLARNSPLLQDTAPDSGQPAQSAAKKGIVPVVDDVQSGGTDLTVHRQRTRTGLQVSLPRRWWEDRVDFTEPGCAAKRDHERKQRATGGTGVTRDLTPHHRLHRIRAAAAPVDGVAAHAALADTALH